MTTAPRVKKTAKSRLSFPVPVTGKSDGVALAAASTVAILSAVTCVLIASFALTSTPPEIRDEASIVPVTASLEAPTVNVGTIDAATEGCLVAVGATVHVAVGTLVSVSVAVAVLVAVLAFTAVAVAVDVLV
jgi:hypothetical protein